MRFSPIDTSDCRETVGVAISATDDFRKVPIARAGCYLGFHAIGHQRQPDAVAVGRSRRGQQRRSLHRAVGLRAALGTESQTRRDVDNQPQRQGPFFDEAADVRSPLPRGHVPIKVSHLIAWFVCPQLREHQADARPRGMIRAREDRQGTRPHAKAQTAARRRIAEGSIFGAAVIGSSDFRRNGQIIGVLASNRRCGNKPRFRRHGHAPRRARPCSSGSTRPSAGSRRRSRPSAESRPSFDRRSRIPPRSGSPSRRESTKVLPESTR